jgi:GNAT superfamily N-acetyltransferase
MTRVRPVEPGDRAALVAIAAAVDETGPVSASDPRYVEHLQRHGRFLVAVDSRNEPVGFGGAVPRRGAWFLTDLFVAPEHRGGGHGGALLRQLWSGSTDRVTSSSQDPRALASYARAGARPRWPLVYLHVPGSAEQVPEADPEGTGGPGADVGWDYPHAGELVLRVGGAVAVADREPEGVVVRRALTPEPSDLVGLVRRTASMAGPTGRVRIVVPGPHPALPDLLGLGAHITDVDLWCATDGAAQQWDPSHELPHAGLG